MSDARVTLIRPPAAQQTQVLGPSIQQTHVVTPHAQQTQVLGPCVQQTHVVTPTPIRTLVVAQQGPAGPAGAGERASALDLTHTRYWYLLYNTSIKRVDNSVSPSIVAMASSTDWANRETLSYT